MHTLWRISAAVIRAGRLHHLMTTSQLRWRLHIARSRSQLLRLPQPVEAGTDRLLCPPSERWCWLPISECIHIMRTTDFQEEQLPASVTYMRNETNSVARSQPIQSEGVFLSSENSFKCDTSGERWRDKDDDKEHENRRRLLSLAPIRRRATAAQSV
jgi:hypothetical protein